MSESSVGSLLKELLKKRSLTMRKLSGMTGIDTSTISRIVSGKRKARLEHLQKFAESLEFPVSEFFAAAGYATALGGDQIPPDDFHCSIESIQHTLKSTNFYSKKFTMKNLRQQLNEYTKFAQTDEGKETIVKDFEEKLNKVGSIGPFIDNLKEMFCRFSKMKGKPHELALMGGAILYFIMPVDVIPDYIFPFGYVDDAMVVKIVLDLLASKMQNLEQVEL